MSFEVMVLGPVRVEVGGQQVALNGRLGRSVVAVLALADGRVVSVDSLIDQLWGAHPPATARQQVHIQVSKLRQALANAGVSDAVRTEPDGYRLSTCRVDLAEVRRMTTAARAAAADGSPSDAAAALRAALALWVGAPLGGVSPHLASAETPFLDELRLRLLEECIDAELVCGRPTDLIPELTALVRAHPLRERLHHRLMVALYRAGRRADALAAFRDARRVLSDELGVDPSTELRELEAEILRSDQRSDGARAPAQPPEAIGAVRVVLVTGMPGIGGTALAVRVAASVAGDVLGGLLHALGMLGEPIDLAGCGTECRGRTAARRILVVLDDAADQQRAEPLAAGTAGGPRTETTSPAESQRPQRIAER